MNGSHLQSVRTQLQIYSTNLTSLTLFARSGLFDKANIACKNWKLIVKNNVKQRKKLQRYFDTCFAPQVASDFPGEVQLNLHLGLVTLPVVVKELHVGDLRDRWTMSIGDPSKSY